MIYDFQKASLLKRISAFLLDFILVTIFATLFAFLISLITNYSGYVDRFTSFYEAYGQQYGIVLNSQKAFESFTEEELTLYQQAINAMNADPEVISCWGMITSLALVMVTSSLLLSTLLVEFVVPMILKNGQTVGKKIFNIAVIRVDGVKATHFQLFARALLGKCAIEYMIPGIIIVMMLLGSIGIVGPIILLVLLVAQIVIMIKTPENCMIHDLISSTAVCDKQTQMIFNTTEDMVSYKEQINKEMAESASY